MTVIEVTRPAKCKDCKHCKPHVLAKRKHQCLNADSVRFGNQIALRDLVCDQWELI